MVTLCLFGMIFSVQAQSVGINADNSAPNSSAMLHIKATNKGLLIPNITLTGTTDGTTIITPAVSLLVYNTATASDVTPGYYYNSGTSGSPLWARLLVANANLTGAVTSTGNAALLGSFTSANLSGAVTDETGTGVAVFATSPTLVTPVLGMASATSLVAGGATANASAVLDASSTTQGFLPPRMTYDQKIAISSPAAGLIVWCSDCGTAGEIQVFNGSLWTNMIGGTASTVLHIGDSYGGGRVAYILQAGDPGYDANVRHGLIVAITNDQFGGQGKYWAMSAYQSTSVTGTLTTIGSGSTNTDKIIAQNDVGTTYAAGLARSYTGGGYSDWFLPSIDELTKLYAMKLLGIGGFISLNYWSSSENSNLEAIAFSFGDGVSYVNAKHIANYVRAVRTF